MKRCIMATILFWGVLGGSGIMLVIETVKANAANRVVDPNYTAAPLFSLWMPAILVLFPSNASKFLVCQGFTAPCCCPTGGVLHQELTYNGVCALPLSQNKAQCLCFYTHDPEEEATRGRLGPWMIIVFVIAVFVVLCGIDCTA
ncbi:Aste57867_8452 [Aphanomyces stellatus]|uniref:Aste57867_8452 protein n=1 Tax=Aphanomyces stellatus TaxID=120398 RepID=A0A485KKF7_9STRA|nr:hypothetical protein As57867_008420 [Aphanomyces stellatus]VFT85338.1 Aste57867_8452 [Aphanomyces stellatus]